MKVYTYVGALWSKREKRSRERSIKLARSSRRIHRLVSKSRQTRPAAAVRNPFYGKVRACIPCIVLSLSSRDVVRGRGYVFLFTRLLTPLRILPLQSAWTFYPQKDRKKEAFLSFKKILKWDRTSRGEGFDILFLRFSISFFISFCCCCCCKERFGLCNKITQECQANVHRSYIDRTLIVHTCMYLRVTKRTLPRLTSRTCKRVVRAYG